jgi:putative hydrolase of the HAD superfamily
MTTATNAPMNAHMPSHTQARKRIVFDLGAVLFRWHPLAMLQRELPHVAVDESSARHWASQIFQSYQGDWGEFDRGAVAVPELVQRISRRTGLAAADVQTVVDAVPCELQPMADTVALVHRLHAAGHTLHYLSNMPAPYADILERNAFFACFESGIFSARVHHNKPEAAIFDLAQQLYGVPAAELVFLDDHEPNVRAAQALGWNAIQFRHARQAETDLLAAGWVTAL